MGGHGSGSRNRQASRTDEFLKVDLAKFKRGWFATRTHGTISWTRDGIPKASLGLNLAPDHLRLEYTVTHQGQPSRIDERFDFAFTEQPFGGRRRWIVCRSCRRRCRVLYGGPYFRCRRCHRATYPSQYEPVRLPGISRADRVRSKLGGHPGLLNPFPLKPKGMHWRTYRRLQREDWAASDRLERALYSRFDRMRKRSGC